MRNAELLERVADKIELHPEQWGQSFFVYKDDTCGTTYCIGGWAAVLSGIAPQSVSSFKMGDLLGLTDAEREFIFFQGMNWDEHPMAHKETAEWLRGIARGDDVIETAPEWWDDGR